MDGYTYDQYEAEQERLRVLERRRQIEEEMDELPFVTVPMDNGSHKEFIYYGRTRNE